MLQGMKILVADDDEVNLNLLCTIIEALGGLCSGAVNGKKAMELLESNTDIDLMVLDLQMPVMNGFEVLAECKGNPYLTDISVIVLASDHHEKELSLALGADDFLTKPFSTEELKLRITKLVLSRRKVLAANHAKKEFLAMANHELRTPMHHIIGLAELLNSENQDTEQRELVTLLKNTADGLTHVITEILHFTQMDQLSATTSVEPFSLRAMVQGALDAHNENSITGATFTLNIADTISDSLSGPSVYVFKIFRILIENTLKFSSEDTLTIEISEEPWGIFGARFCCSVSDPGIKIPAEFHENFFEPFTQGNSCSSRKFEESGLELAIAKRMVELMGGTIHIRNNGDGGDSFNFSFYCHLTEHAVDHMMIC